VSLTAVALSRNCRHRSVSDLTLKECARLRRARSLSVGPNSVAMAFESAAEAFESIDVRDMQRLLSFGQNSVGTEATARNVP
jgi:hypothetical protein